MRYVKNTSSYIRHFVNEKKSGFTLCGQFYEKVGFTPSRPLSENIEINCGRCLSYKDRLKNKNLV